MPFLGDGELANITLNVDGGGGVEGSGSGLRYVLTDDTGSGAQAIARARCWPRAMDTS